MVEHIPIVMASGLFVFFIVIEINIPTLKEKNSKLAKNSNNDLVVKFCTYPPNVKD
jgi:hypothetical protein